MEEEVMNLKDIKIPIIRDIEIKKSSPVKKKQTKAITNAKAEVQVLNISQSSNNVKYAQNEADVKITRPSDHGQLALRGNQKEKEVKNYNKEKKLVKQTKLKEDLPVLVTQTVDKVHKETRVKSKTIKQPAQKKETSVSQSKKEDKPKKSNKEEIKTVNEVIESVKIDEPKCVKQEKKIRDNKISAKSNRKTVNSEKKESKVVCKETKVDIERSKSKAKIETSKRTVSQKPRKTSLTKSQSTKVPISRKTETKPGPIREIVEQDDEPRKLLKGPKAKREAKFEQKQTETKNSRSTKRALSEQKVNKENKNNLDTNIKPIEFVVEETVKSKHQSKGKQQKHIRNKSAKNVKEDQFKIAKSYDLKEKRFK